MKNYAALILSITLLIAMGFGFSSCKDDDPPAKPKLSFAETEITVNEDDGILEVELTLDKPHSKDLRIEYELGGTASDQDVVGTAGADYEVVGDHGVVEIESGETTGVIKLDIYGDAGFEPDETIVISIMDTNTDAIELTADDEVVVTVKNDDDPIAASFASPTMTVNEDDALVINNNGEASRATLQVPVQLDKPAPVDVVVEYTIDIDLDHPTKNFAIDSLWGVENDISPQYFDYKVIGTHGQLVIPKGATSGNIQLQLFVDFQFENDELIEITLKNSSDVQTGTNKVMSITLEQQDGKVIALVWDKAHTDVDMDMFLWVGEDTTTLITDPPLAIAINASVTTKLEIIFIPAIFADGAFGLSFVYYQGTADPMNFEVQFADFTDGQLEAQADFDVFPVSYSLANINPWDDAAHGGVYPPAISQRFVIDNSVYSFGKPQVPASGSRLKPGKAPSNLRRGAPAGSIRPI